MLPPMRENVIAALMLSATLGLSSASVVAANSAPTAVPLSHLVPDAADRPYPGGTILLEIDATDTPQIGRAHV